VQPSKASSICELATAFVLVLVLVAGPAVKPDAINHFSAALIEYSDAGNESVHLNVTIGLPEAQTFDTQTISVSSYTAVLGANNSTTYLPSPGPISISIFDTNRHRLPYGCTTCNLTSGAYALSIYLDGSFGSFTALGVCPVMYIGIVSVEVRDLALNTTAFTTFKTVFSPAYQSYLFQCQMDAINRTTQDRINSVLVANTNTAIAEWFAVGTLGIFVVLLASHREARRLGILSWWDRLSLIVRLQLVENPANLILDEDRTWARHIPLEMKRRQLIEEKRILRAALLENVRLLTKGEKLVREDEELVRAIREARAPKGLPILSFLDRYVPVPERERKT